MTAKIVGFYTEVYTGKSVSGHNCEFTYTDTEFTRHIIVVQGISTIYTITLSISEGECFSGWCCASFGELEVYRVDENVLTKITHIPRYEHEIIDMDIIMNSPLDFSCNSFNFSSYGGDEYYPSGYYTIDETFFIKK
jgi:hypothetical protein